jgi:type VI secretion system protein ImpA
MIQNGILIMSTIDTEALLTEISPQAPTGDMDLSTDPAFIDLEIEIKGTPEREFDGKTFQEAKDPNWKEVQQAAVKLLSRSHDLRVAMFLTRALLHTEGLDGLAAGLALLHGMIDRYWDGLFPLLDPEDNNDPLQRLNILASLSMGDHILEPLKRTPLCASPRLGQFCYRDILLAHGKLGATNNDNTPIPKMVDIEAAFKDSDVNCLLANKAAIKRALNQITALNSVLKRKMDGSDSGGLADFGKLQDVLSEMEASMEKLLEGCQMPPSSESDGQTGTGDHGEVSPSTTAALPAESATDIINGRQDVIRLLDKICLYYEQHEPGSPIPLLLGRARQLVEKNFIEIIQNLAPDSVDQINRLFCVKEESQ